jgi:hypothetical protein
LLLLYGEQHPAGCFYRSASLVFEVYLSKKAIGELLHVRQNPHKGLTPTLTKQALGQILLHAPAYVMPEPQMLIPNAREKSDENGDLTDEETRERMHRFLTTLAEWTERMGAPVRPRSVDA